MYFSFVTSYSHFPFKVVTRYKYKINVFKNPFSDISRLVKTEKQLQKTSTVGIG